MLFQHVQCMCVSEVGCEFSCPLSSHEGSSSCPLCLEGPALVFAHMGPTGHWAPLHQGFPNPQNLCPLPSTTYHCAEWASVCLFVNCWSLPTESKYLSIDLLCLMRVHVPMAQNSLEHSSQ